MAAAQTSTVPSSRERTFPGMRRKAMSWITRVALASTAWAAIIISRAAGDNRKDDADGG